MYPSYLNLSQKELENRTKKAWKLLNPCRVCPRKCGVNRLDNSPTAKRGFCQVGPTPIVSSYHSHYWEERCISGINGSGIIFFTSCNLACVYCQNFEISQLRLGQKVSCQRLGEMMIELQKMDCHNINLCSPSIYAPQILKALLYALPLGLKLPFVYNTGGYDSVQTLNLLDGIVDIYMPDIKYSDNKIGLKYSKVPNYWTIAQKAIKEMFRQVGDLQLAENARSKRSAHRQVGDLVIEDGLAKRGLLVRHLILPEGLAGTKKVMGFLAKEISKDTYVNIMAQYWPTNKAYLYPEINRRITRQEFEEAINLAKSVGLHRFDKIV